MTKFLKILSLSVLTMGLVTACGGKDSAKTDAEKEQENVKQLLQQHSEVVASINAMGTPAMSWSYEKLTDYENKLNRLDRLEHTIRNAETDNVSIIGRYNTQFIADSRELIRRIRAEKSRGDSNQQTVDRYNQLLRQFDRDVTSLTNAGTPVETWSKTKLQNYVNLANTLIANVDERLSLLNDHSDAFTNSFTLKRDLQTKREDLAELRKAAQDILAAQ